MFKKAIYAGLLCSVIGVPMAHAQTLSARGVQAVDSASGQSLAASLETLTRVVEGLNTQMSSVITRLDTIDTRLDGLDTRLDAIENRLDGIDLSITNLDARVTALEAAVNTNTTNINSLNTRVTNIENNPPSPGDTLMADMQVQVVTSTLCRKAKGSYTVKASCPAGYKLLSCSGGSGDLDEKYEGYNIRPISDTTCEAIVKEPACYNAGEITARTNLYAFCFKF